MLLIDVLLSGTAFSLQQDITVKFILALVVGSTSVTVCHFIVSCHEAVIQVSTVQC